MLHVCPVGRQCPWNVSRQFMGDCSTTPMDGAMASSIENDPKPSSVKSGGGPIDIAQRWGSEGGDGGWGGGHLSQIWKPVFPEK